MVLRDQVEPVNWAGEQGRFLLRSEDTGGLYTFFEVISAPGGGPPLHIHDTVDETFYVIEGEYEIRLESQVYKATPGTLVYGPRGVAHEFRNVCDVPSKMLCVATPAGVEGFFEGLSELFSGGRRPDWNRMQVLADAFDIRGFQPQGPPPGVAGREGAGRPGAGGPGSNGSPRDGATVTANPS
jgi:quercetin dioxygenase-like cupin family protein